MILCMLLSPLALSGRLQQCWLFWNGPTGQRRLQPSSLTASAGSLWPVSRPGRQTRAEIAAPAAAGWPGGHLPVWMFNNFRVDCFCMERSAVGQECAIRAVPTADGRTAGRSGCTKSRHSSSALPCALPLSPGRPAGVSVQPPPHLPDQCSGRPGRREPRFLLESEPPATDRPCTRPSEHLPAVRRPDVSRQQKDASAPLPASSRIHASVRP